MPPGGRRAFRAFTLLELIVVMVMMTVVLAVAAPNLLEQVRAAAVRKAAAEFIALAQLARSTACLEQEPLELRVDAAKRVMYLARGEAPVSRSSGIEAVDRLFEKSKPAQRRIGLAMGRREIPERIRCVLSTAGREEFRIAFKPDGSAEDGRVVFTAPGGREIAVRIDGPTGRARVEERR